VTASEDFLSAVAGFTRVNTGVPSADRPFRLAVVGSGYLPMTGYPAAPPLVPVTFEGESTLSTKLYPYMSGYIPYPLDRVVMAPVGNTYVIIGKIGNTRAQGFWQNAAGTESAVEFGVGSYYDDDTGLVITNDASVAGKIFDQYGKVVINNESISTGALGTGTNATTTYADLPGGNGHTSITKRYSGTYTDLVAELWTSCAITVGTVPSPVKLAIQLWNGASGVDYNTDVKVCQALNQHHPIGGIVRMTGVAAGTYTIQGRIATVNSARTVALDTNDWCSIRVREVAV